MLYWGAQGITRDIAAAVEYYRLAAESGDAQALFDYGIILIKVNTVSQQPTSSWHQLKAAYQTHKLTNYQISYYIVSEYSL